jgi:dCMP deaminase
MEETMSIETSARWHAHWLKIARAYADRSKDPSTKVGCIAVRDRAQIAAGYNGLPRGVVDHFDRYADRDTKLAMTVHSEGNLVADAARRGVSLDGATAYITHPPCSHCAGLLIQAGVAKILHPPVEREFLARWDQKVQRQMYLETGVLCMEISEEIASS